MFTRWYDFCRMDAAMLTGTATYDHTTAQMKWLKHDCVLIGNGIWLPWEMANSTPSGFLMHYAPSPMILDTQKPTTVIQPTAMIVAREAKNLDNALAFLRYLYRKDIQTKIVSAYAYFCARTDISYTEISGLSAASRRFLGYIDSDKVKLVYRRYNWCSLNDTVTSVIHGMMTGSKTPDAAIDELVSKANA